MNIFRRRRFDADLKEELAGHLAEREASHVRDGLSPAAARRQAVLDFGNPAVIHETSRDVWLVRWVDNIRRDARIALRMLARAPGFTFAAIATLALGIGANAALFTVVDTVLLRPMPYADAGRLVMFGDRGADGVGNMGYTTWVDYRDRARLLESTAMIRSWMPTLVVDGEADRVPAMRVSASYFSMLGVRPALGRDFTPADDRPDQWRVLIISDGLWRRRFGADPAVIGRVLRMNDRDYQIVGVLPPAFEPLDSARFYQPAEMYAALGYDTSLNYACRSCQHLKVLARIRPDATIESAEAELNAIRAGLVQAFPQEYLAAGRIGVEPLRDVIAGPVKRPLLVLLGAVGFVLLIACANVASLLVARLLNRRREIAVRAALGAGTSRLTAQLLIESLTLALIGGAAGLALAAALLRGMTWLAPVSLPRVAEMTLDVRMLLFTLAASLATAVAFGLLPALRASRLAAAGDPRTTAGGGQGARRLLVAVDLALALVLVSGAGLMLKSVSRLLDAPVGFDPSGVLSLQFSLVGQAYAEDGPVVAFQQRLLDRVSALPGVERAAVAGQIPLGGNGDSWGFHVEGRRLAVEADAPDVERYSVTPGYLAAMRIPIVRGRGLLESDVEAAEPVMLVSESTAEQVFPNADPIGQRVRVGDAGSGPWRRIVGVTGNVRHTRLDLPPSRQMYLPQAQLPDSFLVLVVKVAGSKPDALLPAIRAALRDLDPGVPIYEVASAESLVAKAAGRQRFVMRLLVGFAGIALLLAAVGLYGVIAYSVARRTREVGVRMALGATPRDIVRLVLSGGAGVVVAGLAAGAATTLLTARYLGSMLFGVEPHDVRTLATAILVLAAVALAAHLIPLGRALRIQPASALRQE